MFKLKKIGNVISLLVVLGLSACAANPKTDFDPTVDFSQYRTFLWQYSENSTQRKVVDPVYDSPLFEKKLEVAISNGFLDKGFTGSSEPDMYLTYHMADAKQKSSGINFALGYGRYSRHSYWSVFAPHAHDLDRDEVLVIVDALDAKTQELIWRGWTKTTRRSTPHSPEEVARLANKILAGFPPG